MKWVELMQSFRAAENKEIAILVIEEARLRKVVAVWPMIVRTSPDAEAEIGELTWDEAWKHCDYRSEEIMQLAPGTDPATIRRAIALRLIYPDGSQHSLAKMAIQKMVRDKLGIDR